MNMYFDISLAEGYKSAAQKTRVLSEAWVTENVFCPCCGNPHISKLENNLAVADMRCKKCGEVFELKSKNGNIGKKILDGAYETMIERISSFTNPELFVLQYSPDYAVTDLTFIPKFFFVPNIIEKRKPLPPTARRHGWVGCNILYSNIPEQGRITIIRGGQFVDKDIVVNKYVKVKSIQTNNIESRGWLFDILNCVNSIRSELFTLKEMYGFITVLHDLHPENNNVEAKIRQQLQVLRDKRFIEFLGNGVYKKII